MPYNKIFVVFKTHLDVGFTDYAARVVDRYFTRLLPSALDTAQRTAADPDNRFIWTTGSWLICEYLEKAGEAERKRLEEALLCGDISWHALPFTTHTECMNRALFEYGLSLSERLDKRFGKKTIAAKMTDVPGHTRAIVPILAQHGVEFLHIGVNPACRPPEVPPLFRWRAPDGSEITVMYEGQYGDFSPLGDTGAAVYFAHAGDNAEAPSPETVAAILAKLRAQHPQAHVAAADLNAVAVAVREVRDGLPVVTREIGDTWIHGIACDPRKMREYRALLSFAETLSPKEREPFYRNLLMVPEHTWGLDVKTHFFDRQWFCAEELAWIRNPDSAPKGDRGWQEQRDLNTAALKVACMERSWREQRAYLTSATASLSARKRRQAERLLQAQTESFTPEDTLTPLSPEETHSVGEYRVAVSRSGSLTRLRSEAGDYCTPQTPGGMLLYEVFGEEDYAVRYRQYNEGCKGAAEDWALEDFHKYGMAHAVTGHRQYRPTLIGLYRCGTRLIERLSFEEEATNTFGCPRQWEIRYDLSDLSGVNIEVIWKDKQATRVTESLWFGFGATPSDCRVRKLGEWINVSDTVSRGGRCLWGTDFGVKTQTLQLETKDAALISCGTDTLMRFSDRKACADRGLFVNLYNNVWATNFPLWYDEDAGFRMRLTLPERAETENGG